MHELAVEAQGSLRKHCWRWVWLVYSDKVTTTHFDFRAQFKLTSMFSDLSSSTESASFMQRFQVFSKVAILYKVSLACLDEITTAHLDFREQFKHTSMFSDLSSSTERASFEHRFQGFSKVAI